MTATEEVEKVYGVLGTDGGRRPMSETPAGGAPAAAPPMPRPPGSVVPRRPRAPDQRGEELEPESTPEQISRRKFSWRGLTIFFLALGGCSVKFFFPRTLTEPKTKFPIGRIDDYGFGVDDRLQQKYRIWVCRDTQRLYVILRSARTSAARRTGSRRRTVQVSVPRVGLRLRRHQLEGPAPKPMQRCHVELAPDGQIIVDKLVVFDEADHGFDKPGAYLPLS